MKANEARLLDFLWKAPQMVIPIFQRTYSWSEKQCEQLWNDIERCGTGEYIDVHFVGSIVHVADGLGGVTKKSPLLIIDGQQRLTTVSLLLAAMAEKVEGELAEGLSKEEIKYRYLIDHLGKGNARYKLILSKTDGETFISIIDDQKPALVESIRIRENYRYFLNKLGNDVEMLQTIWKGLQKILVVEVALERGKDNPQLIFESMNSTGKELSQADLIRNYVLMGLEQGFQTRMYEGYWFKIEQKFGQEAYGNSFDGFMRYYLTIKRGQLVREYEVYEEYKDFSRSMRGIKPAEAHTEALLADLYTYADIYCCIALGHEQNAELKAAFDDIRELRADVVYPFLMEVYHDHRNGFVTQDELLTIVRWIDSYIFRRAVVGVPTQSMNRTFAVLSKAIDKSAYLESVAAQLLLLSTYRRFPKDDEFFREFQKRDLFNFPRKMYYLRRLNNFKTKVPVQVENYSIEHILPQNKELPFAWQQELGAEWQRIHAELLHTLGNLTLVPIEYNSAYSDRPFHEKRDMPSNPSIGLARLPLQLNEGIALVQRWNEAAIQERAEKLAARGLEVWQAPKLSEAVLSKYNKPRAQQKYNLSHFAHIASGKMKGLYEAFRASVLALDSSITEEFLKLYVAFKAETNIVDVTPSATNLKLTINMKFSEIHDSRGICTDVSNIGHWGNGQVEVILKSIDDLPYIIGLVQQSLDAQLGGQD